SKNVIPLPAGRFSFLQMLAAAVNGNQQSQTFKVTYSDGTEETFTRSFSDWFTPRNFPGESIALAMPYRNINNGARDNRTFNLYHYSLGLDGSKVVTSLTLPNNRNVLILAITMVRPGSVYALNQSAPNAISFQGSSDVNVAGDIVVNSTNGSAFN